MEPIDLNLDKAKFPNVTRLYGTNPVDLARSMDRAQSLGAKDREPTRTDLISCMIKLENDLEHKRLEHERLKKIANSYNFEEAYKVAVFNGYAIWEFLGNTHDDYESNIHDGYESRVHYALVKGNETEFIAYGDKIHKKFDDILYDILEESDRQHSYYEEE